MKAGDLRCPYTLLRPKSGRDAWKQNRRVTEWETVRENAFAMRQDVSGREFWQAQAYHAEDIVTFTIRYCADVDTTWRLVSRGASYNILEVNQLGDMRDYTRLKCRLVSGGGA